MATRYEKIVKEDLEREGYKVLSSGWPDFLAYRVASNGKPEIRMVEVKGYNDHLRDNQKELHSVLSAFGVPVQVMWEENQGQSDPMDIVTKALSQLGSRKSAAKAASSRENGKLGGRPKKIDVEQSENSA